MDKFPQVKIGFREHNDLCAYLTYNSSTLCLNKKLLCGDCWSLFLPGQRSHHDKHTTYTPKQFNDFFKMKEIIELHERWVNKEYYFKPLDKIPASEVAEHFKNYSKKSMFNLL